MYGRRGQKQFGLDIVGEDRERRRFVYQVRRLQDITPSAIRAAVVGYAGASRGTDTAGISTARRFNASRFVLATAASIHDDTALIDEIVALQEEYRGDLDVQVIGVEHLSAKLRDAAAIVAAFFGRDWARAFSGVEVPEIPPGQPTGLGLLEGPLAALKLEAAAAHAEELRESQPAVAAEAHRAIADQLQLVADPSALVRRRVAQFARPVLTRIDPAAADLVFDQLRDDRAWSVRYHLTRSLTQPTGGP